MQIQLTARNKKNREETYGLLEQEGLQAEITCVGGEGSLQNPYEISVEIQNRKEQEWEGIIHTEFLFEKANPQFFLPGVMYGRNRGETPLYVANEYPRLREGEAKRPASSWWMVRSDRLSHPAAFVYDEGRMYGLCVSPYFIWQSQKKIAWNPGKEGTFYQYTGFTCSLEKGSIGCTLGYENAPWLFVQSHRVEERQKPDENCFCIAPEEKITWTILYYEYQAEDEREVYRAVEKIYENCYEEPRRAGNVPQAAADLSGAVYQEAWIEEDLSYSGFVFEEEGHRRFNKIYSLTWTNGLSVAVPMLMAALRTNHEHMRDQALCCIEHIAKHSLNPRANLPYGAYDGKTWNNEGWWFDGMHNPGHSGYLTGQAVYYMLKAWEYEKKFRNITHDTWMDYAKKVIAQIEKNKNGDAEYAYIFSETTGAGIEYDSLGSAWCLAASVYYSFLTKDLSYLEELKSSEEHYYQAFVKKAVCYGGPLDTDKTVDSEGILSYIRAVRYLHELTGEEVYLEHLRDALCYEYTFKFCYNSPVKTPPLSTVGWSSCGGSITSVANPHIHPMSSTVIDEMIYYLGYKEDSYVKSRLKDTILWSCQTYNHYDKEYDFGYKGWMSERFCHCQGLLVQKYPDKKPASTWFALMSWACGSILEGLCGAAWDFSL